MYKPLRSMGSLRASQTDASANPNDTRSNDSPDISARQQSPPSEILTITGTLKRQACEHVVNALRPRNKPLERAGINRCAESNGWRAGRSAPGRYPDTELRIRRVPSPALFREAARGARRGGVQYSLPAVA